MFKSIVVDVAGIAAAMIVYCPVHIGVFHFVANQEKTFEMGYTTGIMVAILVLPATRWASKKPNLI